MGKFSDYVGTIKNQTESLRETVSAKSGVDCSKMSIGECSNVVDNLEVTSQEEARYIRPSWYPDIENIVMKAPNIKVGSTTYYPLYIMLYDDSEVQSPFYKKNSTTSSAINYYRGTGADAYIFSDLVENDIANANENTLQVGTTITHTWDRTKDIGLDENDYKVRWIIAYSTNLGTSIEMYNIGETPCLECVIRQGLYKSIFYGGQSSYAMKTLKYLKICKDVKTTSSTSNNGANFLYYSMSIEEIVNDCPQLKVNGFDSLYSLKRFVNNGVVYSYGSSIFSSTNNIKFLELGTNINIDNMSYIIAPNSSIKHLKISCKGINANMYQFPRLEVLDLDNVENITSSYFMSDCYNLKYVKIPRSVVVWNNTDSSRTLTCCRYVELYEDFNISGVNLTGLIPKYIKWIKDLCGWLKDRTGEEANTMIIGTSNLNNANNIYLTFNPNDKRDITFDGVTADTEGAMSITEFITTQLNWTLS